MHPAFSKVHDAFALDSFEDLAWLPVEITEKALLDLRKRFEIVLVSFYAKQKLVELGVLFALQHFLVEFAVRIGDENVELAPVGIKFFSEFQRKLPYP